MSLFNAQAKGNQTPLAHHSAWLSFLRERVWIRIRYEEEMIPSDHALLRHWKRSCWVVSVWSQSTQNHITYPPLNGNGWKLDLNSTSIQIERDSDDNISVVRIGVALLKKGCGCKTGCPTGHCKCQKTNHLCGPGCKCVSCCNRSKGVSPGQAHVEEDDNVESNSDFEDDLMDEVDDVMKNVFGGNQSEGDDNSENLDNTSGDEANSDPNTSTSTWIQTSHGDIDPP